MMKLFRKYIFPPPYGLLVYFTIRLLHDVDVDERFWRRDWTLNAIEMTCSIAVGYIGVYLYEWLFKYYDRKWPMHLNYQSIVRELVILILANLILMNLVFVPMAALTDDGLSWADVADLNMIPTLYAIIYYGIARSRQFFKAYVDNRILLERMTNDHLQTELKFLKAQYHPHFLFNAINTIYFQMDEDLPGAKRTLEKFSELLRYQLYDQQLQVTISQEIAYLNSFVELQKARSSTRLNLIIDIDSRLQLQKVYPLLFLPLVENAFKYVGGTYQLTVKLYLQGDKIVLQVINSIAEVPGANPSSGGIGLENLERRLQLLYPGKHKFTAVKQDDQFIAELELEITDHAS